MSNPQPFQVGVNLGGWLSQYPAFDRHHFGTFITPADIQQIASWGMDHVRLPVDYPVLEADEQPFVYRDEGWTYIDQAVDWCRANNLRVILDLHKAPGFSFDRAAGASLFDDPVKQDRFIALWEAITRRYHGLRDTLAFELLNEIVLPSTDPWNQLARRAIAAIRALDADRLIVVGGNMFNAVSQLDRLDLPDDPHLLYTFHFYEPIPFTHQKASWVPLTVEYNRTLNYPGDCPGLGELLEQHPEYNAMAGYLVGAEMNRAFLARLLQPALDFMQRTGRPLYCGEYGVVEWAPVDSSARWHADLLGLLREYGIGRAFWSYKKMDFGLVDDSGCVVRPELIKLVSAAKE